MIQENWDESVQTDVVNLLQHMIPKETLNESMEWGFDRKTCKGVLIEARSDSIRISPKACGCMINRMATATRI